jgi:DnaJ domain
MSARQFCRRAHSLLATRGPPCTGSLCRLQAPLASHTVNSHTTVSQTSLSQRLFSDHPHLRKKKKPAIDPYKVLGITQKDSYALAKRKFLQLAMQHHPDTSSATTEAAKQADQEAFLSIKSALDLLEADNDGVAVLKSESAKSDSDAAWNAWFKSETGHDVPFMDYKTMQEVAKMTQEVGGETAGLDRDGGMWTLARMVTASVKAGKTAESLLQLETGTVKDRSVDGELRRRRRR